MGGGGLQRVGHRGPRQRPPGGDSTSAPGLPALLPWASCPPKKICTHLDQKLPKPTQSCSAHPGPGWEGAVQALSPQERAPREQWVGTLPRAQDTARAQCEFKVKPPEGTQHPPMRLVGSELGGLELRPGKGAGHKPGPSPPGRQGEEGCTGPQWRGWAVRGCRCPPDSTLGRQPRAAHSPTAARLLRGCHCVLPAPQSRQARPYLVQAQLRDPQGLSGHTPWEASPEPPCAPGSAPGQLCFPRPVASGPGPSLQG